jgi:tRNA threonylcarbamoyladenosine biosynthesis protein TsaE
MREPGPLSCVLADEDRTRAAGAALARAALAAGEPGWFATLAGELGAGKTTFVAGLLGALDVEGPVRSPTYTLVESYPGGRQHVEHLDWYRLGSAEELDELGFRELLGPDRWVLVEWPERAPAVAASADLAIVLAYDGAGRRLELRALTAVGRRVLARLKKEGTLD